MQSLLSSLVNTKSGQYSTISWSSDTLPCLYYHQEDPGPRNLVPFMIYGEFSVSWTLLRRVWILGDYLRSEIFTHLANSSRHWTRTRVQSLAGVRANLLNSGIYDTSADLTPHDIDTCMHARVRPQSASVSQWPLGKWRVSSLDTCPTRVSFWSWPWDENNKQSNNSEVLCLNILRIT